MDCGILPGRKVCAVNKEAPAIMPGHYLCTNRTIPTGALNKQNSIEVMEELNRINLDGTSILLVTHDMKVAARCERVLYIEDGDIREDITLGKWQKDQDMRARERTLNDWLIKLGW